MALARATVTVLNNVDLTMYTNQNVCWEWRHVLEAKNKS